MGLSAWYSLLIIILQVWDAINDPLIGSIIDADRRAYKRNKFLQYIFIGSIGLIVGGALCFLPFPGAPTWAKITIFMAGYVIWDAFYTVANVPYGSLLSLISTDPADRASLSAWRSIGSMFDFGADARAEGGENGQNHKGLVTFDRKYKKDSFYAYKAWLSDEPFVHLCGKLLFARLMGKMLGGKKKGEKAKPMGFEVTPEMMSMMSGFTVLRLITMAGGMMDAKFTKEDLLKLNAKLNKIRAPKK